MNYFVALLAFAAIMIVLATLVMVVVEAIQGLTTLRQRDFRKMLGALFDGAIKHRAWSAGQAGAEDAGAFTQKIVRNHALSNSSGAVLQRLPIIGSFASTDFKELETRQFIEQLARTDAGRKLAELADAELAGKLDEIAYEFERFGHATRQFFARRARMLSILVAMVIAFAVNVDAVSLYANLAKNRMLAEQIVSSLDIEQLEAAYQRAAAGGGREDALEGVKEAIERVAQRRSQLEGLGLPVGWSYFPHCERTDAALADPRCAHRNARTWIGWALSTLVAGGLIGLGAPFWFNVYRVVGSLIPGIKLPERIRQPAPAEKGRGATAVEPERALIAAALVRAFRTALDPSRGSHPPPR